MFRISEFLLEPTRELNSFHRNIIHLYSSFEFGIQVVLTFFYIGSQAQNLLRLCPPPMLLPLQYCLLHPCRSSSLQRHYHSHMPGPLPLVPTQYFVLGRRCVVFFPVLGSAAMYVHARGLCVWHVGMWGMSGISR